VRRAFTVARCVVYNAIARRESRMALNFHFELRLFHVFFIKTESSNDIEIIFVCICVIHIRDCVHTYISSEAVLYTEDCQKIIFFRPLCGKKMTESIISTSPYGG